MRREKNKLRKRSERTLTRATSGLVSFLARMLSLSALRHLADGGAFLIRHLAPSRQRVARDNLRGVFGDQYTEREYRALAADATRSICRTMAELLKFPYLSPEQFQQLTLIDGEEHLRQALDQGKGVILVTAHYGNWEVVGPRLVYDGFPVSAVARDSEDPSTAALINRARETHGMKVVDRDNPRAMLRALHDNRILAILPDQHAAGGSIVVDFMGRPAATAVGVATLAERSGCAVLAVFCTRRPDGRFSAVIQPALSLAHTGERDADIRANTILVNEVIGREIMAHPQQWLWLHRRWKVDAPPEAGDAVPPADPSHA
ncbi:MAG TPA: lysophospholipid acyltransferase family protein [Armatimonadota bacterium]|jgi:KDO2-lipid IV(A) lauroyltransferase